MSDSRIVAERRFTVLRQLFSRSSANQMDQMRSMAICHKAKRIKLQHIP
jgi:hypothetical protein